MNDADKFFRDEVGNAQHRKGLLSAGNASRLLRWSSALTTIGPQAWRTTTLVATGTAAFADMGLRLLGAEGATRIISYIVSGIGFPGAGAILKDGNTLLRPLVNYINRRPIDEHVTEAIYTIHVVSAHEPVSDARDLLFVEAEAAHYPIREIETLSKSDDVVELAAVLVSTTANPAELDAIVTAPEHSPVIKSATWTVGTPALAKSGRLCSRYSASYADCNPAMSSLVIRSIAWMTLVAFFRSLS